MRIGTVIAVAAVVAASLSSAGCAGAQALRGAHVNSAPSGGLTDPSPRYYLALGDSLSTGFQPLAHGGDANTDQGYVNDLYAYEREYVPGLQLVQLGCPGDTTTSLLTGAGNTRLAQYFQCDRAHGSQLAAAVAFLRAHHNHGEVPLVTIDIGINDEVKCTTAPNPPACVTAGIATISKNLPKILRALRAAAPTGTEFAAMNVYDPALRYYLLPTRNPLHSRGPASVPLVRQVNIALQKYIAAAHFKLADAAAAFDSYDTTTNVPWNGAQVPQNVALLCAWTWNCSPPPVGPNIHPNALGYGVIAQAFEKAVGRL